MREESASKWDVGGKIAWSGLVLSHQLLLIASGTDAGAGEEEGGTPSKRTPREVKETRAENGRSW